MAKNLRHTKALVTMYGQTF